MRWSSKKKLSRKELNEKLESLNLLQSVYKPNLLAIKRLEIEIGSWLDKLEMATEA